MKTKKHFSDTHLKEISGNLEQLQRDGKEILDNVDFMKLFRISRNTSLNWRSSGKIKFSRVGRRAYFKSSDIERMLEEHLERHGRFTIDSEQ